MAASKIPQVPLAVAQGATFRKRLTWQTGNPAVAVNLTGYTARAQIRAEVSDPAVLATMTTENGGIVLGGVAGTIDLHLPAVTTTAFAWESGVYDLELVAPGGDVTRLCGGVVTVSPEVTRV